MKTILLLLSLIGLLAVPLSSAQNPPLSPAPRINELIQTTINVVCVNFEALKTELRKIKEIPVFYMTSDRGNVKLPTVIFINVETLTWTLVEQIAKDLYCVVGVGSEFEIIPQNNLEPLPSITPKGIDVQNILPRSGSLVSDSPNLSMALRFK